jgi:membrane associated rhomboid family serine protease
MGFTAAPAAFVILAVTAALSALALRIAPGILQRCVLRPYRVVRHGDYLPVAACGFVHGDFMHLLVNMLTLYFFGPALEATIGTPRFLALYFLGLVISSLGTVIKHRNDPDYASLGASGAINAVLFAFIVYYPTQMLGLYFVIPVPAVLFAFGYLAYSWWASKQQRGRINHDAHLDGALTGLAFVALTDFEAWARAIRLVAGVTA